MSSRRAFQRVFSPAKTCLACLVFFLAGFSADAQEKGRETAWMSDATFIFLGTPIRLGVANLEQISPTDKTAVVRVDEILRAPAELRKLAGHEITVELLDVRGVEPGRRRVLFARGWLLADGVAVTEVGRTEILSPQELEREIVAAERMAADERLFVRLRRADLVITGTVKGLREQKDVLPAQPSEHDPQWIEATVAVEQVLKGSRDFNSIPLLFPGTRDVAWVDAPRFREGQSGIWILQVDRQLRAYTALGPLDFQPRGEAERIQRLLRGTKESPQN